MLIVRMWKYKDIPQEISELVQKHISSVDVAKALGIISMVRPKRLEELQVETHQGSLSSERFCEICDTLPIMLKEFRAGPGCRSDSYDLPDLDTLHR